MLQELSLVGELLISRLTRAIYIVRQIANMNWSAFYFPPHTALLVVLFTVGLLYSPKAANAAQSLIIVDNQSGYILAETNANRRAQIGSLTKIASSVVVLDAIKVNLLSLNDCVTVPVQAVHISGANPAGIKPGDRLTIRDLLYCSLMASDNIATYTLAFATGSRLPNTTGLDPVGNFVAHMNALARKLEMKHTLFLNPHGLDDLKTPPYSTATDIARLTRYAYTEADFLFFVSQTTREVEIERSGQNQSVHLINTNQLLGKDGIDGVKTGRTNRAGDCLVVSSFRSPEVVRSGNQIIQTPRRIIVVLLNSPNRFGEGLELIRRGWSLYGQWASEGRPIKSHKETM